MSLSAFQHGFSTHWMDVDRNPPEWFVDVVGTAIAVGYRRIDCNPGWDTESMVGTAIARSPVPRDELFVTTVR
jgi:diketogulonate reductase-like aldo/keto reductase